MPPRRSYMLLTPTRALFAAVLFTTSAASSQPLLSKADHTAGWALLSGPDAKTQWRGYKQKGFPEQGWTWVDGTLTHAAGGGGGDIITTDQFADFELRCQFKTAPKANSGI